MSPAMLSIAQSSFDGADEGLVRLGDDAVVGHLRDGAAVEDGASCARRGGRAARG